LKRWVAFLVVVAAISTTVWAITDWRAYVVIDDEERIKFDARWDVGLCIGGYVGVALTALGWGLLCVLQRGRATEHPTAQH